MLLLSVATFFACVDNSKEDQEVDSVENEPTGSNVQGTNPEDNDDQDSSDGQDDGTEPDPSVPDEDCPDGVTCFSSFPVQHSGTTLGSGVRTFDSYSCAPSTDESGEEVVYRLTVPNDGFLALDLTSVGSGVDVDVHLLQTLDSGDCIDRGHWSAGAFVPAGHYWVVVDTWVNSSGTELAGDYTLQAGLTSVSDLEQLGMSNTFAFDSLYAFDVAWGNGETDRFEYAITDFSLHSSEERMWLLDLSSGSVLANLHLAHGEGSASASDDGYATSFSNIENSHQSSLGMMKAAESYSGSFGYSMRLDGLEYGYNDNARSRFIVMHGWEGSRPEYVDYWGSVAPTWGCPAVDDREVSYVVDTLKEGALMFFWYPDGDWSVYSDFLP